MTKSKWGGKRPGAGRPRSDVTGQQRRKHSIYCTDIELVKVRKYLRILRQNKELAAKPNKSQLSLFDD